MGKFLVLGDGGAKARRIAWVIAQRKGLGNIETRAGPKFLRGRKRKPRGLAPHGEIRRSRKEMALPA